MSPKRKEAQESALSPQQQFRNKLVEVSYQLPLTTTHKRSDSWVLSADYI